MLRVFWYIDVLTCVIYICMIYNCEVALNWTARLTGVTCCLPWRLLTKTSTCRWMRRHMVYTNSAYWDSEAVAAWQIACVEQKTTDELTVLLFCDVHIDKGMALNVLQCMHLICRCRGVQTNSAETALALLHMYNVVILTIISSGLPPVFHECTSVFLIRKCADI